MKSSLAWMLLVLSGALWLGCSDDPNLVTCEGGACEAQEDCVMECEDVCGDPDFLSYRCVEGYCQCQCFFGCE